MGLKIDEYHEMLADARGLQLVHFEDFSETRKTAIISTAIAATRVPSLSR